jgi:hypothetical protein
VTLTGSGTDADGSIASYQWTKISGPATFSVESSTTASTKVLDMIEGEYEFELTVKDNKGATAKSRVKVTVNPAPPKSKVSLYPNPVVNNIVTVEIDANTYKNYTSIVIYNVSGEMVYNETFFRTQPTITKQIDISKLIPGIYFVEVTADINTQVNIKMIRQ